MPTPPKQFLSKAERIRDAQLPGAKKVAEGAGRRFRLELKEAAENKEYDTYDPALMRRLVNKMYRPDELKDLSTPKQRQGLTRPSSRVKGAKMSPRKLTEMGDAINTGLTAERRKILNSIQRLPPAQRRKIYEALEGYAMD